MLLNEKSWNEVSFTDKDGARRFNEFVEALKTAGAFIDPQFFRIALEKCAAARDAGRPDVPDITELEKLPPQNLNYATLSTILSNNDMRNFLKIAFDGSKNFKNHQFHFIKTGTANDTSSAVFDITEFERITAGSKKMNDVAKEQCFAAALLLISSLAGATAKKDTEIRTVLRTNIDAQLSLIETEKRDPKIKERILGDDVGMLEQINCALTFLKNKIVSDVDFSAAGKRYVVHHNSSITDDLRKRGAKILGLKADKWNPADVYLISKSAPIADILACSEAREFNSMFNRCVENKQIVPISLKASDDATTGALSVNNFAPGQKIDKPVNWVVRAGGKKSARSADEEQLLKNARLVVKQIRDIGGFSHIPVVASYSLNRTAILGKKLIAETVTGVLTNETFIDKIENNPSWNTVWPPMVELLWRIAKKGDLDTTIQSAISSALSLNELSTMFYKVTPTKVEFFGDVPPLVTINLLEFALNTTAVLVHYNIELKGKTKHCTAQIRSKGDTPQIVTFDTTRGDYKPLALK